MFLHILNEKERKNFLDVAYYIANCDDDFAEEEKEMIRQYRRELELSESDYIIREKINLENVLGEFSKADRAVKNAIFMEIIALVFADDVFADEEKKIVENIMTMFKIGDGQFQKTKKWIEELKNLYGRAEELIQM